MTWFAPIIHAYVLAPFILYSESARMSTVVWVFCIPYIWLNLVMMSLSYSSPTVFQWVQTLMILMMGYTINIIRKGYISPADDCDNERLQDLIIECRFDLYKLKEQLKNESGLRHIYNSV